jgi:hypothetical protein
VLGGEIILSAILAWLFFSCVASNLLFVLIKRLQQKKGKNKKMRVISYLGILHAIFIGKTTQNKKRR